MVFTPMSIRRQVAALATRLMQSSVAFVELEDVPGDPASGKTGGISKERFMERLHDVFQQDGESALTSKELQILIDFCFENISYKRRGMMASTKEELAGNKFARSLKAGLASKEVSKGAEDNSSSDSELEKDVSGKGISS